MNIFITGIAGFLGSNLGHHLLKQGHNIFGNDNFIGGYKDNLSNKFHFFDVEKCLFRNFHQFRLTGCKCKMQCKF